MIQYVNAMWLFTFSMMAIVLAMRGVVIQGRFEQKSINSIQMRRQMKLLFEVSVGSGFGLYLGFFLFAQFYPGKVLHFVDYLLATFM